ncbi:MAG: ATP-binding protein [Pirellulaceae bacterium]
MTLKDAKVEAFCSAHGPEIFRSVAYPTEVWFPDPLDVETIHADVRELFDILLSRATRSDRDNRVGRLLLLLGGSGSGKTHLMRALRTRAHQQSMGYFGYMQMTSSSGNYSRYILQKVVDSLDVPYYSTAANEDRTTGLMRLSAAVAESSLLDQEQVRRLREDDLAHEDRANLVLDLADDAVRDPVLQEIPIDLVRAMLFLQSGHPAIRSRVMKYLRAEALSEHDQRQLGGISPLDRDESAQTMIERLGHLMWAVHGAALILCVDQLEDVSILEGAADKFPRVIKALTQVAAQVPSSIVIIACLEDYYDTLKGHLDKSAVDRLENDPPLLTLKGQRTWEEITDVVGLHLRHLFEYFDVPPGNRAVTYPLPEQLLRDHVKQTTRAVLTACKEFREQCMKAGQLVGEGWAKGPPPPPDPELEQALLDLDQTWNDFLASFDAPLPDNDEGLIQLLAKSIELCSEEIDTGHRFATSTDGFATRVSVRSNGGAESTQPLLACICNKPPQGGSLGKQIEELFKRTATQVPTATPIVVRSIDYRPKSPKAAITKLFAQLVASGGRYVIVPDTDWRTMAARQPFRLAHESRPHFSEWLQSRKPIARLKPLREILNLDLLQPRTNSQLDVASSGKTATERASSTAAAECLEQTGKATGMVQRGPEATSGSMQIPPDHVHVGHVRHQPQEFVVLTTARFTKHTAFLGGTGSGKTTAALNIIEQLLMRGIPALLIDRKGDLVTYARDEIWRRNPQDPVLAERQQVLRDRLDVAVYTPGHPNGRPIALPVAPHRLGDVKSAERQQLARQAAHSLGEMLGYKTTGKNASRISVMVKAIELMAEQRYESITLTALIDYIHQRDDALISAIGVLDVKLFDSLLEALQTLLINRQLLFPVDGERLCAEELLGIGPSARHGRTRLSVISTKFLGDTANVQFWVAQLLLELARWMSKSPSATLQAVVMFDEADLYLPASSKPATKEPMENLLKRARSAGVGIMLATQSPGDFDYKSRENIDTWFVGKIKENTAIQKMKPMLSNLKQDIGAELSAQETGNFYLVQGADTTAIRSQRSLVETEQLSEEQILAISRKSMIH